MKKLSLVTIATLGLLTGLVFQNCSGGSVPDAATQASSVNNVSSTGCLFDGNIVGNGTVQTGAYTESAAAAGTSCPAQATLTCNNGVWEGASLPASSGTGISTGGADSSTVLTSAFSSCSQATTCQFAGTTIPNGGTATAYSAQSVPNGSTCASVSATLTCTNGALTSSTGSPSNYTYTTCSVAAFVGHWKNNGGWFTTYGYGSDPTWNGAVQCPAGVWPNSIACTSQGQRCFTWYNAVYGDGVNYYPAFKCQ